MSSQEYLSLVIRGLVDYPDNIKIVKTIDEMGTLLSLEVDSRDMGKIIGKEGSTAKAIRTLMRAMAYKTKERLYVKVIEPSI